LRFQASNRGWAFHPLDAELALRERLQHHHDFRLDHHRGRRPLVRWHPRERPAARVLLLHFELPAHRYHAGLYRQPLQEQQAPPVLRPG